RAPAGGPRRGAGRGGRVDGARDEERRGALRAAGGRGEDGALVGGNATVRRRPGRVAVRHHAYGVARAPCWLYNLTISATVVTSSGFLSSWRKPTRRGNRKASPSPHSSQTVGCT